jgi:hypothetical protein
VRNIPSIAALGKAVLHPLTLAVGITILLAGASGSVRDIPDVYPGAGEGTPAEDGEGAADPPHTRPIDTPDWNPPTGDYVPTPGEGGDWNGGQPPNGDPVWRTIIQWLFRNAPWLLRYLLPDTGGGDGGGTGTDPGNDTNRRRRSNKDIALGVTDAESGQILRLFTRNLNEEPYHTSLGIQNTVYWWDDWDAVFNTSVDFRTRMPPSEFRRGFREVVAQAAYIHVNLEDAAERFNLEGYHDLLDEDELRALTSQYAFAYELDYIRNNDIVCLRTTFYLSGSTNPIVERNFKRAFCE